VSAGTGSPDDRPLPEPPNVVLVEHHVVADIGHVFELTLGNQHSIEGVAVVSGEALGTLSVKQRHVEWNEALAGDATAVG